MMIPNKRRHLLLVQLRKILKNATISPPKKLWQTTRIQMLQIRCHRKMTIQKTKARINQSKKRKSRILLTNTKKRNKLKMHQFLLFNKLIPMSRLKKRRRSSSHLYLKNLMINKMRRHQNRCKKSKSRFLAPKETWLRQNWISIPWRQSSCTTSRRRTIFKEGGT